MRQVLYFCVVTLLTAGVASASPDLEKEMLTATGKAFAKVLFGTAEEARAECEAGRAQLKPGSPKFLAAYVEACLALTVAKPGTEKKPATCPYYRRAIDIWRKTPPPKAEDEVALKRARQVKQWKESLSTNCPEAGLVAAKPKPIAVPAGATVETLEGISYVMPAGWMVEKFDDVDGHGYFKQAEAGLGLLVERRAVTDVGEYTQSEVLKSGRSFEWVHREFIDGSGFYVFYARVKFDTAIVNIGLSATGKENKSGIDKDTALTLARNLAESVKLLGPRRCIGDCGPGKITP